MWIKKGNIFSEHWAQLPVAHLLGENKYEIFYSRRVDNKSHPCRIIFDKNTKLISDKQQLDVSLGKPGTFDWAGVMPTSYLKNGDTEFLYYIGWSNRIDVPYHNSLGLMIRQSGNIFEKLSDGPIFNSSRLEPGYIGTIEVMKENVFRGWYLSCREWEEIDNRMEPIYDIKYAESNNGIDWTPKNISCIKLLANEGGISRASVIKKDDLYYMWFSVRARKDYRTNKHCSYRIQMASSKDGIAWERKNKEEFPLSLSGWDSEMIEYPCIIDEEKNLTMFYNGNKFGESGIGYAEKSSLSLW